MNGSGVQYEQWIMRQKSSLGLSPDDKLPYEAAAFEYEGKLTTRAGSGGPGKGFGEDVYGVDPNKLFGG